MRYAMRTGGFAIALLLLPVLLLQPVGAMAQQPAPMVTPPPPKHTMQQSTAVQDNKPLFSVGGLPVRVTAPVAPPYSGSAYRNLAGQPMRGADVVARIDSPAD